VAAILSSDDKFFDVVLLDLTLPDISAHTLVNKMIDKVLFCPVILLTSNEGVDFSIDQFHGISDYLIGRPNRQAGCIEYYLFYRAKKIFFLMMMQKTRYSDLFT
jgi:FixJ family two-component response regulator